ncbi:MAG: hypothetical protein KAS52_04720 [Candidatus Heimdallarchaeota archaeon]|nr:hypothetical protein [Candidatus Heimdallarchaeota archaeon]
MGHKDILDDSFIQEEVRVIRDPKLVKIFYDESYGPIFWVLRSGPMTVKDIEHKYNKVVKSKGLERGLGKKDLEKLERSDKSIYRYIKELTKAGLVAPAGHRVVLGKTATEILYVRTAKIFYLKNLEDDNWRCKICMKHLSKASDMLSLSRGIKPPNPEMLAEIMAKIESDSEVEIFRVFEEEKDKVQEIFSDVTFADSDRILYIFRILYLALHSGKYKEMVEKIIS